MLIETSIQILDTGVKKLKGDMKLITQLIEYSEYIHLEHLKV